jgi:hypothetical protein
MLHALSTWPAEAIVAAVLGLLSTAGSALAWLSNRRSADSEQESEMHRQGWQRSSELEKVIDELHRVVAYGIRRESGWAIAFELVSLALKLPESERGEVLKRATEILKASLSRSGERGS